MIAEGQKVAYAGDDPMQDVGSVGKVLQMSGHEAAHVHWETGPRTGSVELVDANDLVTSSSTTASLAQAIEADSFASSVGVADAFSMQVRAAFDDGGETSVVTALEESGHLALLAAEAEEAVLMLGARIRMDAQIAPLLATLDIDEQDVVVSKVAVTLLGDLLKDG